MLSAVIDSSNLIDRCVPLLYLHDFQKALSCYLTIQVTIESIKPGFQGVKRYVYEIFSF